MAAKAAAAATTAKAVAGTTAAASGAAVMIKWTALGVASAVAVSGAAVATYELAAPAEAPRSAPALGTTRRPHPAVAPGGVATAPTPTAPLPAPKAVPEVLAHPSGSLRHAAQADHAGDSGLDRELGRLRAARALMAAGNAQGALEELRRYEHDETTSHLRAEAMYLKMEAFSQLGNRAAAQNAARRLLHAFPEGPHAARARSILEIE
jgi:hypothetical protein